MLVVKCVQVIKTFLQKESAAVASSDFNRWDFWRVEIDHRLKLLSRGLISPYDEVRQIARWAFRTMREWMQAREQILGSWAQNMWADTVDEEDDLMEESYLQAQVDRRFDSTQRSDQLASDIAGLWDEHWTGMREWQDSMVERRISPKLMARVVERWRMRRYTGA